MDTLNIGVVVIYYDNQNKFGSRIKTHYFNIGDEIDVNDLIVSAMLAASYKTRPVHVQLADKLKQRKEEVQVGDRIPYIFIESSDPKSAKSELGEDPQYAIKNNLK